MKKVFFIASLASLSSVFFGCTKNSINESGTNSRSISLAHNIATEINEASVNYISHDHKGNDESILDDKKSKPKVDKTKAQRLAFADAVGAAVGSRAGLWGTLWGGFLTTLALEPHLRTPASKKSTSLIINPTKDETKSNRFDYGYIGDGHNALMQIAYVNNFNTSVSDNRFNDDVRNLMLNNVFSTLPVPDPSIGVLYNNLEGGLIEIVSLTTLVQDNHDMVQLANASNIHAASKILIEQIINDMVSTLMIDGDFTGYLDNAEETIKHSDLSSEVKNEMLSFIAVANSSTYYWRQNFPGADVEL